MICSTIQVPSDTRPCQSTRCAEFAAGRAFQEEFDLLELLYVVPEETASSFRRAPYPEV